MSEVCFSDKSDSSGVFYKINRSFDIYQGHPFFAAVSNDGRKILYIKNKSYSKGEENKDVTYYVDGKLVKTYTAEEIIDCNKDKEKCELFYDSRRDIYEDYNGTTRQFRKDVTEQEKYLHNNFIFNKNDTIYLVDGRKKVLLFDLNRNAFIQRGIDFDSIYPEIKYIEAVKSKVDYYNYPYKYIIDIEDTATNKKLSQSISEISNLKFVPIYDPEFGKYALYRIELTGYLDRSGKLEIESIKTDKAFDKNKITEYLRTAVFNTDFIPKEVDKIYLDNFFGGYRSYDEKIAEQATLQEKEDQVKEVKRRMSLERIDDIYIPKNLYECMTELDKILDFESKKQLKDAQHAWEFNSHMGGLGMWIRNNWGLNEGSRLSKYFGDCKVGTKGFGNDGLSEIIITQYISWLKGDKKAWKEWEKQNPIK